MKQILFMFFLLLLSASPLKAEESAEKAVAVYINLAPSFVTNYGGQGALRYVKVDVSLRLTSTGDKEKVEWHMPYIRSELVSLFSRQQESALTTRDGKEALRQMALKTVQTILEKEEGSPIAGNLLFTNFIVQK